MGSDRTLYYRRFMVRSSKVQFIVLSALGNPSCGFDRRLKCAREVYGLFDKTQSHDKFMDVRAKPILCVYSIAAEKKFICFYRARFEEKEIFIFFL